MRQICFIGDGITQGLGDESGAGWAVRLGLAEAANGRRLLTHNLGVAYQTSTEIGSRWRAEALSRLHDADAAGVVFSFGLFDMADILGDGISVPLLEALSNAEAMIADAAAIWPVLWVGPPPVHADAPPLRLGTRSLSVSNARLRALSEGYKESAQRLGVPYLDIAEVLTANPAWRKTEAETSGIFPSGTGHQLIADTVRSWSAWQSWMRGDINVTRLAPPAPPPHSERKAAPPASSGLTFVAGFV